MFSLYESYLSLPIIMQLLTIFVIGYIITIHLTSKNPTSDVEGFSDSSNDYSTKYNNNAYDDYYCSIYDELLLNRKRNTCEIDEIVKYTNLNDNTDSVILDIGSGTGHHVNLFTEKGFNDVMGIDISPSMVNIASDNYPDNAYIVGNAMTESTFKSHTFSHITCMYMTIYCMKNKLQFFKNCAKWLKPNGYLVIHLINRDNFVKNGNADQLQFSNFTYSTKLKLNKQNNTISVIETIKNNGIRKNKHTLYAEPQNNILTQAVNSGFEIDNQLRTCGQTQYLYVLRKVT